MSKYISINEIETFRFHDARFINIKINDVNMVWELEQVNVTKANSQNDLDTDMEAGMLFLTLENCNVTKIEHYGVGYLDKDGKIYKKEPNIIALKEDYHEILFAIPDNHGWISRVSRCSKDQNSYRLSVDILTFSDSLIIDLEYSEVEAEWDVYLNEAYYLNFGK